MTSAEYRSRLAQVNFDRDAVATAGQVFGLWHEELLDGCPIKA
jgi:hypothetical protein